MKYLFWICLLIMSVSISASNINEKRIFLDNDNLINKFRIANYSEFPESCHLRFTHHSYNDDATEIIPISDDIVPINSATPYFRYSPKRFELPVRSEQYITFRYRRTINSIPNEYRSYLVIDCKSNRNIRADGKLEVSMTPRIIHKVPLIVRTGEVASVVDFKNIREANGVLSFELHLEGQRSVFGDIKLIEKSSNRLLKDLNNIAIYPETSHRKFSIKLAEGVKLEQVQLTFSEIVKYGGSIVKDANL